MAGDSVLNTHRIVSRETRNTLSTRACLPAPPYQRACSCAHPANTLYLLPHVYQPQNLLLYTSSLQPQPCHPSHEGMAPDLNMLSQPPRDEPTRRTSMSARSGASSRRTSQIMGPPTVPASAAGPLHTNSDRVPMPHRVSSSHEHDGPLRHPRPLTAAELYAECEKEQEAVVCTSKWFVVIRVKC